MEIKDGGVAGAARLKAGRGLLKKFWWVPFLGIFLFLLAGGYYALVSMRRSAHELAGGENFEKLSANSAVYDGKVAVSGETGFFQGEDERPAAAAEAAVPAGGHLTPLLAGKSGVRTAGSAVTGEGEGGGEAGTASSGSAAASALTGQPGRPQLAGALPGRPGGAKTPQGAARSLAFKADGSVAGIAQTGQSLGKAGQAKAGRAGVLDSLKGAFRASIYGARTASEDSAKSWTARSFDATPEASTTLQYSEEMRKDLDMVNPNSIPGFLRDQDISAEGAGKLTASQVTAPSVDKEAMKAAADRAKEEGLGDGLFSGMMNSMFKGLGPKTDGPPETPSTGGGGGGAGNDDMSLLSDPKDDRGPGITDEFGYTSYGDPNGFQTVFDSDGNQVGCTDNAAGFSIPFGAPGCP